MVTQFSAQVQAVRVTSGSIATEMGGPSHAYFVPIATELQTPLEVGFVPPTDMNCYSITSSARPSSDGGTVRPSALAVFRLMINSNLVGACTGKSAGFSPLRIRST